ncbi:MAG: flagellar motor protein MotB [Oligoflexales bacterium]|nr:flagellar motor protein MotB [Oligoflexales bacterium]
MAKKQKCPAFENHERWLVSYADMLTLLFAVFVVLFALKEGGQPEVQKAAGAMQESFNTPLEDIPIDRKVGPQEQGIGIFEHFKADQIRPPLIQKYPSEQDKVKVIDKELKLTKTQIEERLYGPNRFRDAKGKEKGSGEERVVTVERTEKGFKLKLLARHFFRPGETYVRGEALHDLDEVIEVIKGLGRDIVVEGHTDASPPADGAPSNWELSALRASGVIHYMIAKHNFPATRLGAAGYADMRPIAHNGTEAGRNLNRRIEIQVNYE